MKPKINQVVNPGVFCTLRNMSGIAKAACALILLVALPYLLIGDWVTVSYMVVVGILVIPAFKMPLISEEENNPPR